MARRSPPILHPIEFRRYRLFKSVETATRFAVARAKKLDLVTPPRPTLSGDWIVTYIPHRPGGYLRNAAGSFLKGQG